MHLFHIALCVLVTIHFLGLIAIAGAIDRMTTAITGHKTPPSN